MFSHLRIVVLLLFGLSLGFAPQAQASHAQGGSLTYTSLGGNSYRIRLDLLRDCSGVAAPTSFTMVCQTACGSSGTTALLNQVGSPIVGTPYNSVVQPLAICPLLAGSPNGTPTNFATYRYEGTITLAPNQWILSVEESARVTVANIASVGNMRLEATLDNRGRVNNSVQFSDVPTFVIPVNQPNVMHIGAFDADGDSLSYSLERPLNGCNFYEFYTPYPSVYCIVTLDPRCPRRIIGCASSPGNYSQLLPIAVANDTVFENGLTVRPPCPTAIVTVTKQPRFSFDPATGTFSFTPNRYVPTPAANGDNKYVVSVKVTEWRRESGTTVAVGTTRRELIWIVYDGASNTLPCVSPTVTVQYGTQITSHPLAGSIAARAGEPISVTLAASNPGSASPLVFTLEQNTVPGAIIQAGATAGTGRLTFTPPLNLPHGVYRVSVSVTDDAGPVRNLITVPVTFYVYPTVLTTRHMASPAIAAYPTPFTSQVQFQLPTAGVQQLTVCDQLGRVVDRLTSQADGKVQWSPAAHVPAGLYSARSADGKLSVRLLRSAL
jgi:hypothetical protein